MPQIIMAGHDFNAAGWDRNIAQATAAVSAGRTGLGLALLHMANRAEFGTTGHGG